MKLSVSVPDELWWFATQTMGTTSASEVVQIALKYYLAAHPPGEDTIEKMAKRIAERLYKELLEGGD